MKLYFTLLFLVFIKYLEAEDFKYPLIDTNDIHKKCSRLINDEYVLRFNQFFESTVFINDSTAYFNPNGSLHLFKITFRDTQRVELLRESPYNGHNFNKLLFIYENDIYSLGGTGLFSQSTSLIRFDFNNKQWYDVPLSKIPINASSVVSSWKYKDVINVLFELRGESKRFSFGMIDLENKEYNEINHVSNSIKKVKDIQRSIISRSDQYLILNSKSNIQTKTYEIFDLKKGDLLAVNFLTDREKINGKSFIYIIQDSLYFRSNDTTTTAKNIQDLNVIEKVAIKKHFTSGEKDREEPYVLYVLLTLGIILVVILFLNRKNILRNNNENELSIIIKKLIKHRNSKLTQKDLDEILEISHLQLDSLKTKRSQLIKTLNQSKKISLERIRNNFDKRSYDYLVK